VKVKSLIKEFFCSPIGTIEMVWSDNGLTSAKFTDFPANSNHKTNASIQLEEYFFGNRKDFNLELDLEGTDFHKNAWQEMLNIPYGQTKTYGEISKKLQKPGAARAVGMACNKNPVMIFIPCHRVLGANGRLTGYAGGLEKKQWLVKHENCI
jgi:methylated-DNA-[protein]-cysteine S-methyltransferase